MARWLPGGKSFQQINGAKLYVEDDFILVLKSLLCNEISLSSLAMLSSGSLF